MGKMNFVWVFKRSDEFELRHSLRLVRKYYPDANCIVIGDRPKECLFDVHIPHKQDHRLRSTRITKMIVDICHKYDDFILMYDDIFLSDRFDLSKSYHKGELYENVRNPTAYNRCLINVNELLKYEGKTTLNYECHQPQLFNSKKLLKVLKQIDWVENEHVLKSLYCNWYNLGGERITNLKIKMGYLKNAQKFWNEYGCFSTREDMPRELYNWIKEL